MRKPEEEEIAAKIEVIPSPQRVGEAAGNLWIALRNFLRPMERDGLDAYFLQVTFHNEMYETKN